MLEVEPGQSSASGDESLSAKNGRLQNKVDQLTKEKAELLRKVAHYEEYTKRLCTALRKLKGSIDNLAGQSALIGEALSYSCEAENDEQNEENVPEQPQIQTKKKMQTASVLPMVRGFPIRRIIVPLQRLNINSHRHRPNRIHGHRREPWWREAEEEAVEPEAHQRVPVRRLQRVERRQHRAGVAVGVRPRSRPGVRRRQEAAVVERAGAQNRRSGSSHQMLQAVVLLQRLSLTQHQQQQQQRREQEPQPLPADSLRTPVVVLSDISNAVQAGVRVHPKLEEPAAAASVKLEPVEGSSASPSFRAEADRTGRDVFCAGPSGEVRVELLSPPEGDTAAAAARGTGNSHSESTGAAPCDEPEARRVEVEPCQDLPPVLQPAEHREGAMSEEEVECGELSDLPPSLSPSLPCGGERPAEAVDSEVATSRDTAPDSEAISSEMEAMSSSETEAAAVASESDDTSAVQSEPVDLHNGDATSSGQEEMSTQEESSGAPSPASADTGSTEDGRVHLPKSLGLHSKEDPPETAFTPSSSRKRKASASVGSPDKCSRSPRSDAEREQSPHSETEQGCRPRRRCAIRKNYALFFAGWNAD